MLGVALEFKDKPDKTTPYTAENMNDMQRLLVSLVYPVGSYYETSDSDFNPNTAWGGTWELDQSGTVLVSKSSSSSSKFNDDVGTVIGEEEHTLTIAELAEHNHVETAGNFALVDVNGLGSEDYGYTFNNLGVNTAKSNLTRDTGDGQPHNNIQPSKIVNRWHRTA